MDIYSAGEKPIKDINSKNLVRKLNLRNKNIYYLNKKIKLNLVLKQFFQENNTIIFMGAGSITNMAQNLFTIK